MHYILHVALEGFFVQLKAPGRPGPIAVVRNNIILDVNPAARQRGITPGMEKRTARAVAHETEFLTWEEDVYEEAQAKWLDLCTEFTGIIEPEEQNSAFLDLSAHPKPIDVSEKLVRTLVQETGLPIFYGSSCSKWIAKLASRLGDCGSAAIDPAKFLAGLPVSKLTPVSQEHRQRLNFLGYRTIGDILNIPPDLLRQQFGAEGLFIAKAAKGDFMDPPRAIYPRDSLIETLIFDGPVESLETVDLALKDLATRVAARLSNKSLQGQELALSIELENGRTQQLKRRFSKSIHNFPSAHAALRILLCELLTPPLARRRSGGGEVGPIEGANATETHRSGGGGFDNNSAKTAATPRETNESLDPQTEIGNRQSAILAIRLALTNLKHCRGKQNALIGKSKEDSATAVNVVRTVFGDTSVQLGAEIPIARRVKVLREWKDAIGWS